MSDATSRYFRNADDAAEFFGDRMGKADLLATPRLFCGLNTFEPGQSHEPHAHDHSDKLYVVLRGRGSVTIGSERRILAAGEIALAPAGVKHGILADGGERLVVLVVLCPPPGAAAPAPPPVAGPPTVEIPAEEPPVVDPPVAAPPVTAPPPAPASGAPSMSMAIPDILARPAPVAPAPKITTPAPSPITPVKAPAPLFEPAPAPTPQFGGAKEEVAGSAINGTILGAHGDYIEFRPDDLTEPILALPSPGDATRYGPGPARVVLEASARRFNRTMGTARAVQTLDGTPVRLTGLVLRVEPERGIVLVDVGYPIVVRDLGGQAATTLSPGSGVMIPAEGPTRAIVLSS